MSRFASTVSSRRDVESKDASFDETMDQGSVAPWTEEMTTVPRFLSLKDVLGRLTISRSLLYELIKDPIQPFPAPVHIGRRSVWVDHEVAAYIRSVIENERANPSNDV